SAATRPTRRSRAAKEICAAERAFHLSTGPHVLWHEGRPVAQRGEHRDGVESTPAESGHGAPEGLGRCGPGPRRARGQGAEHPAVHQPRFFFKQKTAYEIFT